MNCPYCSIHNLRGPRGVEAHIRISHKDKLTVPVIKTEVALHERILRRADEYERKAEELRRVVEILTVEGLL